MSADIRRLENTVLALIGLTILFAIIEVRNFIETNNRLEHLERVLVQPAGCNTQEKDQ